MRAVPEFEGEAVVDVCSVTDGVVVDGVVVDGVVVDGAVGDIVVDGVDGVVAGGGGDSISSTTTERIVSMSASCA